MANPKGNPQNLKPFTSDQDREKARENGSKGGKRSQEVQREKRQFQQVMQDLLDLPLKKGKLTKGLKAFTDLQGENVTVREAIAATMAQRAIAEKDVVAARFVVEVAGEIVKDINISGVLPVVIKDDITETD